MGFELYNDIPLRGLQPLAAYIQREAATTFFTLIYMCAMNYLPAHM